MNRSYLPLFLLVTLHFSNNGMAMRSAKACNDTLAPEITLIGDDTLCIERGAYTSPGATAYDSCDGDITSNILFYSNVNQTQLGTYIEKSWVIDSDGNVSDTAYRVVHVVEDITPPVITFSGGDTIYHDVNTPYQDSGVIAIDNTAGDITDSISIVSTVNPYALGTYTTVYTVEGPPNPCGYNHVTTATRTVIVQDTIRPVIRAYKSDTLRIQKGSSFTIDTILYSNDNYCTPVKITSDHLIQSDLDVNSSGFYTSIYQVTDCNGNTSLEFELTIEVIGSANIVSLQNNKIEVYPNPSDGEVHITLDKKLRGTITIIDLLGTEISRKVIQGRSFQLTLPEQPGLYTLLITDETGSILYGKVLKI